MRESRPKTTGMDGIHGMMKETEFLEEHWKWREREREREKERKERKREKRERERKNWPQKIMSDLIKCRMIRKH